MTTIAEIRSQYPQYDDLSDWELASALHKKHYADMPLEDFGQRIGLPVERRALDLPPAPAGVQEPGDLARDANIQRGDHGRRPMTELVEEAAAKRGATWGETFRAMPGQIGATLKGAISGLKQQTAEQRAETGGPFGELMNPDELAEAKARFAQEADTQRALSMAAHEELASATPRDQSFWQQAASTAATSLALSGVGAGVGVATRTGPVGMMATLGAATYGLEYAQARAQGATPETARSHAMTSAVLEGATELLPAKVLFKPGSKPFSRLAEFLAKEIPGENVAEVGQLLSEWGHGIRDDVTAQEVLDVMALTTASTLISGGAQSGTASVLHRAGEMLQERAATRRQTLGLPDPDQQARDALSPENAQLEPEPERTATTPSEMREAIPAQTPSQIARENAETGPDSDARRAPETIEGPETPLQPPDSSAAPAGSEAVQSGRRRQQQQPAGRQAPAVGDEGGVGLPESVQRTMRDADALQRAVDAARVEVTDDVAMLEAPQARTKTSSGRYRVNAAGDYSGAPRGVNSPDAEQALVTDLTERIDDELSQTEDALNWYEVAGKAIKRISPDRKTEETLTRLLSFYSQSNHVAGNVTAALQSLMDIAQRGIESPARGRFPSLTAPKIAAVLSAPTMDKSLPGVSDKLMSFYRNLKDAKDGTDTWFSESTVDLWMMRAFGYNSDTPTRAQYGFAKHVLEEVTKAYNAKHGTNYAPRNIQAALWVNEKNRALQKDFVEKGGKATDFKPAPSVSFDAYLARAEHQVIMEAIPSKSLPVGERLEGMTRGQKRRFTQAVRKAVGKDDPIAKAMKLPLRAMSLSSGGYQGGANPNFISSLLVDRENGRYNNAQIDLYSRVQQYVFRQDGVGWFRLDSTASGSRAIQAAHIAVNKPLTARQEQAFQQALESDLHPWAGFTKTPTGYVVLNFTQDDGKPIISRGTFAKKVADFLGRHDDRFDFDPENSGVQKAESQFHWHDWKADPEGKALLDEIATAGSPGLLDAARNLHGQVKKAADRFLEDVQDETALSEVVYSTYTQRRDFFAASKLSPVEHATDDELLSRHPELRRPLGEAPLMTGQSYLVNGRYGLSAPTGQARDMLNGALAGLADDGVPLFLLNRAQMGVTDSRQSMGFFAPKLGMIGINILNHQLASTTDIRRTLDATEALALKSTIVHEQAHALDRRSGGKDFASVQSAEWLAITEDLNDAYNSGDSDRHARMYFEYPFAHSMRSARSLRQSGRPSDKQMHRMIATEAFAQSVSLYYSHPESLRAFSTRAYGFIDTIHGILVQHESSEATVTALRKHFRRQGASERAEGARAAGDDVSHLIGFVPRRGSSRVAGLPVPRFVYRLVTEYQARASRAMANVSQWLGYKELGRLPKQRKYLAIRGRLQGRIGNIEQVTKKLYKAFAGLNPQEARQVYDYLTTAGAQASMIANQSTRSKAVAAKRLIDRAGKRLVQMGLISQDSYDTYRDRYLPRMYLKFMLEGQAGTGAGRSRTSPMGYTKQRKDIPRAVRELIYGEIRDPAFLSSVGLGRTMRDIAILDFFEKISADTDWVLPDLIVPYTEPYTGRTMNVSVFWLQQEASRLRRMAGHLEQPQQAQVMEIAEAADQLVEQTLAAANIPKDSGWRQVPDTKRYGRLRGMYVRSEIYADLLGTHSITDPDGSWAERALGHDGALTKANMMWKTSKVALNYPTQIRNFSSNMVLLHMSGVDMTDIPVLFVDAIQQMRTKGRAFRILKKYGLGQGTFANTEMMAIEKEFLDLQARTKGPLSIAQITNVIAKTAQVHSDLYQLTEMVGKTMKIEHELRRGSNEIDAMLEAQKWLFDYSLVPKTVGFLRKYPIGVPFITFYYKALPRIIETAILRPQKFLPYVIMGEAMQWAIAASLDVDDEDVDQLFKVLPEWLRKRGHAYIWPVKDEYGRWQAFDAGYLFPWAMYGGMARSIAKGVGSGSERAKQGDALGALSDVSGSTVDALMTAGILGGPLPDIFAVLKSGEDPFTGMDVVAEGMPPKQKALNTLAYAWSVVAPPMLTTRGYLGHQWRTSSGWVNPYTGEPGLTQEQAMGRLFGVNIYPMDPEETRNFNLRMMRMREQATLQFMRKAVRRAQPEDRDDIKEMYRRELERLKTEREAYAKDTELHPNLLRDK